MKISNKLYVMILLVAGVFLSCENKVEYNTYDAPKWAVTSGDYSESMTAVIELADNI